MASVSSRRTVPPAVGALDEELRRGGVKVVAGYRHGKRPHREDALAAQREPLATRREHPDAGTGMGQRADELRRGVEHVLAVVDDEQQLLGAHEAGEARHRGQPGFGLETQRCGDRIAHRSTITNWGQVGEPRPIMESGEQVSRSLDRKAGLSDAAHTGERDDPRLR